MGSLVDGMRDASGQIYMRNRYYDPATGQFTQTDPIGLAGGLNAYGFAAGDPVSYSDPYGLSAGSCRDWLKAKWNQFKEWAVSDGTGWELLREVDRNLENIVRGPSLTLAGGLAKGAALRAGAAPVRGGVVAQSGAQLNTADANRMHHIFGQAKHNWSRRGLDQAGNVSLVERVANTGGNHAGTYTVPTGKVHTFVETIDNNVIEVKVFENQRGVQSITDAWIKP